MAEQDMHADGRGGQVDPQLLRLAECPGRPVPYAGRLAAGPGDEFLDLVLVIAAPRDLEPLLRCQTGQKTGVAAPVILGRGQRAGGFSSDTSGSAIPSGAREAGRGHQPGCLSGSARAAVLSPAELTFPPDDPASDGPTRRHAKR